MSKIWPANKFRPLDRGWVVEFKEQQEQKLDADHNWQPPDSNEPPIGGEYAIPIESSDNTE